MSMSTHVVGFRPPDAIWNKMKAALKSCQDAGVEPPDAVTEFFGESDSDAPGAEVKIKGATTPYRSDSCEGIEVDLTKLPDGVKIIRFYNSY